MCTCRSLWVLSQQQILFQRKFSSVERRAATLQHYVGIPDPSDFIKLFFEALKHPKVDQDNYLVLSLQSGSLWPVVYLKRLSGIYLVAIPLIESVFNNDISQDQPIHQFPLINLPFITATVQLLHDLVPIIESYGPKLTPQSFLPFNSMLSVAMPFGKPIETSFSNINLLSTVPFGSNGEDLAIKRPSWFPYISKGGRASIELTIKETVNAVQYDKPKISDFLQIRGQITAKVYLDGFPEITVLMNDIEKQSGNISLVFPHPSVNITESNNSRKLVFNPSTEEFVLCRYVIPDADKLPMRGFYQMRELQNNSVALLLQMKLEESVKNEFEYCRVILPFFNRGVIANVVGASTIGEYTQSEDKSSILWDIGTKWTSRNREVAFKSTVTFNPSVPLEGDPFCIGVNCYVKVEFKCIGHAHISISPKNISVLPKMNVAKTTVDSFFSSGEYIIWNSLGKVKFHSPPEDDPQ